MYNDLQTQQHILPAAAPAAAAAATVTEDQHIESAVSDHYILGLAGHVGCFCACLSAFSSCPGCQYHQIVIMYCNHGR